MLEQVEFDEDGRICEECLDEDDKHVLIEASVAVELGILEEKTRKASMYCGLPNKHCPWAAENKEHKCGEGSKRTQNARAKVQLFCMHPKCLRPYHAVCFAIAHRLIRRERLGV